jgi:hypothetical protein
MLAFNSANNYPATPVFVFGLNFMIDKQTAVTVQKYAVTAIESLHKALTSLEAKCSDEDFQSIRYGVGSSIATINADLLSIIYEQYPELNHIKE